LKQVEDSPPAVTRRAPRQVRMFYTPTQINFSVDNRNERTILELIAADRPGLLSEVGKVFRAERVAINGAKIMTVGERAEDVFYITGADGGLLQEEACRRVQQALMLALDRRDAARS
jgi:[protein-PII] uridylyltransferase